MVVIPDQWSHGISGNFDTASDWSTATVPGFGNDAEITASGTYTVTVNSGVGFEVNSLETAVDATLSIAEGTFIDYEGTDTGTSAGTIAVGNNGIFEIGGYNGGSSPIDFDATGIIRLNSTDSPTMLVLDGSTGDQTVQLSGDGKLILSDNAGNLITGYGTATTTFLNDNTIEGAGTIGEANLDLQNAGTIDADGAVPLIINGSFSATNSGTIECTSTGGLYLVNTTLNNTLGTIEAAASGAVIYLTGAIINDGAVSTVAGSSIISTSGISNEINVGSVTNAGNIVIQPLSTLSLGASIDVVNSGSIELNSGVGQPVQLTVIGTLDLEGNGRVKLNDNPLNSIVSNGLLTTLDNESNTISGAGTIGDANMSLEQGPTGAIDGTGENPLIIADIGFFTNYGKVESSSTGGLRLLQVTLNNESSGVLETTASGAHIDLAGSTIEFGLVQIAAGSTLDTIAVTSIPMTSNLFPTTFDNSGTLLVGFGTTLALGSSINNAGTVVIAGVLEIEADVLLNGTGKVELTNSAAVFGTGSLTNVGNTITGAGLLGTAALSFLANDADGVIDATGPADESLDLGAASFLNEGKMEDTGAGGLYFDAATGTLTNDNIVESDGAGGVLLNTVVNNGKLIADSGVLSITDLSAGTGSLTVGGTGEIEFGSADSGIFQNVAFVAGATGTLAFQAAATTTPTSIYTGTISGFGPGDAIDLAGLGYDANLMTVTSVFSTSTDETTVTATNIFSGDTVALTFAGNVTGHTFVAGNDGSGGTRLTDPLAQPANNNSTSVNVALLGSYMAAAFATAGIGQASAATAESQQVAALHLALPHA